MLREPLDRSIFRAYDIRGIAGKTLREEDVYLIGKAFGSLVREKGFTHVAMARDGRLSGPLFSTALRNGLLASGCDVTDLGMAPTPVLYFAAQSLPGRSGVMLTGSHNPANYNGLKMVVNGIALAEDVIQELYQRIQENRFTHGSGVCHELDVVNNYIQRITENVRLKRPLKIVVDAGNGVTGMLVAPLFKALGCEVIELFCEVNGDFPNHEPDPSEAHNLQDLIHAVRAEQADIGLAFDGDGDRLGVVTNKGDVICADRLLMLFAQSILAEKPGAKIVFDVKCTNHLAALIKQHGGEPIMWRTGHSLIKAKLAETNAQLAGEMSGHFIFSDRWYAFDDALYAGARMLEILANEQPGDDRLFSSIPNSVNTPELKVLVTENEKFQLMQRLIDQADFVSAKEIMTIDGLRVSFTEGWGLLRPSNTSPYLVLRFEATNEAILAHIQTLFREWMLSVKPDFVLPF